MIANHLFGACLPTFGNCADRYCLGGYGGGGTTMQEMLDLAKQVEGLDGLELVGNWHVNDQNIREVAKMFTRPRPQDQHVGAGSLDAGQVGQGKPRRSRCAHAPGRRRRSQESARLGRRTRLPVHRRVARPGRLRLRLPGRLPGRMEVAPRRAGRVRRPQRQGPNPGRVQAQGAADPLLRQQRRQGRCCCWPAWTRSACFWTSVTRWRPAEYAPEAAALLASYGKLDYLHLNDNYHSWDDDMMVGSVHLVEYLELVYWLKRVDYKGWLTLDIFPLPRRRRSRGHRVPPVDARLFRRGRPARNGGDRRGHQAGRRMHVVATHPPRIQPWVTVGTRRRSVVGHRHKLVSFHLSGLSQFSCQRKWDCPL